MILSYLFSFLTFLVGGTESQATATAKFNLGDWIKSNPVIFGLIVAVFVIFVLGSLGFVFLNRRKTNRRK